MQVIKRNGQKVNFDMQKIINAILKAFIETDNSVSEYALEKATNIATYIEHESLNKELSVEDIQDMVEHGLQSTKRKDVATAYIRHRYKKEMARRQYKDLMDTVEEKINAKDVQNQNANVDEHSFGGRMGEVNRAVMKHFALENCMSSMAKNNHLNNEIYIHDLDSYAVGMHNCLSIPFDDLLAKGFNTRQTDVRPANSINTAFQLVAVIFQLQSLMQFGGVASTHLDWTMVPYVRKSFWKHWKDGHKYIGNNYYKSLSDEEIVNKSILDYHSLENSKIFEYAMDMTEKELKQAVEGVHHNLNTLQSRSGNQLPFTSINYGTCTLLEGRMVTKALLEGSLKGVGKYHRTPIFPCGIFQCMKGVNREPGDPNYDLFKLALKSTAQRLYPNYANCDWSINEGYDRNDPRTYMATMGCRTYNGKDINAEPGTNPQIKDGRGNLAPVTIILPTLAMKAKEKIGAIYEFDEMFLVDDFFEILDQKLHEAKDMLIERYKYMCSQPPDAAKFMYENGTMLGYNPDEGIESALKHGTLAIGQLGLAECLQILIGCDHTTPKGMELAKHIEQLFKNRCAEFKEEYRLNFGVYYTPAENTCYTTMKKFKEKYGEIPNVSDKDFFTNSMHVPVWKEISPIEKINIESQLTGYSNAGCITYIELDSGAKNNIEALETLVNYAMDKDIPYFAINVPNDMCIDCGYTDEMDDICPECGGHHIQHLRRVTGYLTGDYKTAFNYGKQKETEMRFKHSSRMKEWKKMEIKRSSDGGN